MAVAQLITALHAFIIFLHFSRVTAFTRTGSGDVGLRKMSCLHSQQAKHLLDGQREKIDSEGIFFIEIGFGNDSHGQVCALLVYGN